MLELEKVLQETLTPQAPPVQPLTPRPVSPRSFSRMKESGV